MSFVWSEQAVSLLQRFYVQEGLSAAETAAALDRALGGKPTRNAVLGKAQRLGWSKPASEPRAPPPPRSFPKARCGPVRWARPLPETPLPPLREAKADSRPKPWLERQFGECAYPLGEPAGPGLQMCCAASTGGETYCAPHRALMTQAGSGLSEHDLAAILTIARKAA
jgi:hypothetical protein